MKRMNVLLDLDQTLISAEETRTYDLEKNGTKSKKFKYHNMEDYYVVFERPGVQPFLDFLFKNFNVSVWTAASKDYAIYVIDKIVLAGKSERKLDYIFFSYHCDVSSDLKKGSKDLSVLWDIYKIPGYTPDNTIIIDDYDEVCNTQTNNCIPAPPFEYTSKDSPDDDYLNRLQSALQTAINTGNTTSSAIVKYVADKVK
jgi:TFIIF-interacting CTD phosphatase-like protein